MVQLVQILSAVNLTPGARANLTLTKQIENASAWHRSWMGDRHSIKDEEGLQSVNKVEPRRQVNDNVVARFVRGRTAGAFCI
jgi:hypothetical protein